MCGFLTMGSTEVEIDVFDEALGKIEGRGPDMIQTSRLFDKTFGFNRLAIMDLSENGKQPFSDDHTIVVCNGEIYNYPELKKNIMDEYTFKSSSDCEVLIPLYRKYGLDTLVRYLDGEYAFCLYDALTDKMIAARDPIGIRPMFYGYTEKGTIAFGSEAKALMPVCKKIMPFPPGHYYDGEKFVCFNDVADVKLMHNDDVDTIALSLRVKLIEAVKKRLQSDAPVGYLLSGGLDSSLVCAIGQRITDTPIKTFAIGMETDPIDLKYAKEVAEFLGTDHTEVIMTKDDVLDSLREVIRTLETWDITTIRASIGMYLLCKYIHEHTDLKVILTGEVSDELFGYKYTDFAPSPEEFQKESQKRMRELYMYDVLRADRCISANALEGRVPFADLDFVDYTMRIDPKKKMNTYNKGKYLLRHAFEGLNYLPHNILFREKAAFSDAVGHSMVDYLKEYADSLYTDEDVKNAKDKYPYCTPFTKESLLYRDIFESYYPGKAKWIKDFWMPNKTWKNCDVNDPSARVLKNYGDSGK
ncbi:asparagine synthase B [uncultured Catenibacterium sp.]|uniref:asparagine synthase B n=1 Tax=uncultured Catenibacterium sp. TaxID=286142 RepID=UPI0025D6D3F0|nr:asparagine synthase B [uncultured Catenibacterium sp.]